MNDVSGINYYITDFCKLKCNASQCLSFPGGQNNRFHVFKNASF